MKKSDHVVEEDTKLYIVISYQPNNLQGFFYAVFYLLACCTCIQGDTKYVVIRIV